MDTLSEDVRNYVLSFTACGRQACKRVRVVRPLPDLPSETNQAILRTLHLFLTGLPETSFIDIDSFYLSQTTPVSKADLVYLTNEFKKIMMKPGGRYTPFCHMSVMVKGCSIDQCKRVYKNICILKDRLLKIMELSCHQQPTKLVMKEGCIWPRHVEGHFITDRGISLSLNVFITHKKSRLCQVHCTFKNIRDRH